MFKHATTAPRPLSDALKLAPKVRAYYDTRAEATNIYVDEHGHLRPKHLPAPGLWHYDGQFFVPPKRAKIYRGNADV